MEPLQNVSHTDQVPFQGNFLQSTQRELLKTRNPLNNPNDWFDKTSAPVSDWSGGTAAYFGWMREAKSQNTRCGL